MNSFYFHRAYRAGSTGAGIVISSAAGFNGGGLSRFASNSINGEMMLAGTTPANGAVMRPGTSVANGYYFFEVCHRRVG